MKTFDFIQTFLTFCSTSNTLRLSQPFELRQHIVNSGEKMLEAKYISRINIGLLFAPTHQKS